MMVTADELTFRHQGADTDALRHLCFSVPTGALCCVAGINGSGKSTLLALLAGLFPPTSGALRVAGCEMPRQAYMLRSRVALVPQDPDLYILGSLVEEDLTLGLEPGDEAARRRALDIAALLGLGETMDMPVHTLSYGQKRKLCLASALAATPQLLLLDEPFAGLDYPSALAMRDILAANKKAGLTQIVVAHDLECFADDIDMFLLLNNARLLYAGSADSVMSRLQHARVKAPCWWEEQPRSIRKP